MIQPSSKTSEVASRIVGIDYGLVRIGIAISDPLKIIASPLMTLAAEKKSAETVTKLIDTLKQEAAAQRYSIQEIVVGLPLLMSGKKGLIADEVSHFVELMRQHTNIPIFIWDERLSSVQAERSLKEGNMNRKKRSKVVDKVAATIILQSYLDYKSLQEMMQKTEAKT